MNLVIGLLVVVMLLSLARIAFSLRRVAKKPTEDWDTRFIAHLRKAGVNSFELHELDFFFELPSEAACEQIAALLEPEGFVMDRRRLDVDAVVAAAESDFQRPQREATSASSGSGNFSLHARKAQRLVVPEIQALSKRFTELAAQHGGKYDGWAIAR